ncbi:PEP-CTERM sorting domain-containing protein [Marinobacter salicampi]|uniref:PEP-CTERM sorting domain-containing protein n=1 Tax=Marinobacter salicampi TaxID=435907 RepID=UPI00140767C8|nr:PEP-CTERM sorting domain-containing protein [Marinobacter salicampi]
MESRALSTNGNQRSMAGAICLLVTVLAASSTANAYSIVIEPDHFQEGSDLSSVAPYVTLQHLGGNLGTDSVYATRPKFDFAAPTGELVFGNFAAGWIQCEDRIECISGFGMTFHHPLDWVSLKGQNGVVGYTGEDQEFGANAVWFAFDENGDYLAFGSEGDGHKDNRGVPFDMSWSIPGMTTLVVGGDTINALEFDDLRFKLKLATVPEPGTLGLLGMGLAGLLAFRYRSNMAI